MAKIETISADQYALESGLVAKATAVLKELAPKVFERGGVIPDTVVNHPAYAAVDNEMRGRVEQYELYHNTPEKFTAYVGKPNKNGMGVDREVGQTYPITVWTGLPIGFATRGRPWSVNSIWGKELAQFYARINGREFIGRGYGEGQYITLKETAKSKRLRADK